MTPEQAFLPWSSTGCTFEVAHRKPCGSTRTVLVDGVAGRCCADHPSRFDPARAVALMVAGQSGAALAYCRCGRVNRRWLPPPRPAHPPVVTLTTRQADVLVGVCKGLSNQQIATCLTCSVDGVRSVIANLLIKLGADNRTQAAVIASTEQVVIYVDENRGRTA